MTEQKDPFANPEELLKQTVAPDQIPKFLRLSELWRRDTMFHSASDLIIDHPAYREIVRMGPPAVPLILESLVLKMGGVGWFHALVEIVGHDLEGNREDYDTVQKAADGWLEWGRQKGIYPLIDNLLRPSDQ